MDEGTMTGGTTAQIRAAAEEQQAWMRLAVLALPVPERLGVWTVEVERRWEVMRERHRVDPAVTLRGKVDAIDSVANDVMRGRL